MDNYDDITIASTSLNRSKHAFTHKYFTKTQYVVKSEEADDYRKEGLNVWECPNEIQGNLCRVNNWIIDNCKTRYLIIVDDDLSNVGRWNGNKYKILSEAEAMETLAKCFDICEQMNLPFWGMNCVQDKGAYMEYTPFAFTSYVGNPLKGMILPEFDLRYDERLMLKEDYDMTLQIANKYRMVLRFNFLNYNVKQHNNVGGCATYRTIEREKEQFELLQKKWGSKIVRTDSRNRSNKKKGYDINPIIKVPIKGI